MIRRRIFAGSMAAALSALTLAGCSQPTSNQTQAEDKISGTLSISWQSTEAPALEPVIEGFKKKYPDVNVKLTSASIEQYFATLPTQLSSGQAADVFLVWAGYGNPVAQKQLSQYKYLADLSDRSWASEIPENIRSVSESDGKTVIMPTTQLAFTTWYNQKAMKEVGLTPPANYKEVLKFCADARRAGRVAYSMGAGTLSSNSRGFNVFLPDVLNGQTTEQALTPLVEGKETYSKSKPYIDGMNRYEEMIKAGCFPDNAAALDVEADDTMFASGQALGSMANSNNKLSWTKKAPDVDFAVAPPTDSVLLYPNKGAAVNAAAKNRAAANAFVDFFATPEMRTAYANALSGVLPAIPTDAPITDPSLQLLAKKAKEGRIVGFPQQHWNDPKMDSVLNTAIQGMFLGDKKASDVLAALDGQQKAFLSK